MMWQKIKQINAPLRFTNVVLVYLLKVINISSQFKIKIRVPLQTELHYYHSKPTKAHPSES